MARKDIIFNNDNNSKSTHRFNKQNSSSMTDSLAPKILVLDDEAINIELFKLTLESLGYSIDSASNGFFGLQKVKQRIQQY